MTTYSENTDLILDNGQSVDNYMLQDISAAAITAAKDASRLRAYNLMNDNYLRGKTALPATHIASALQIEVDLVVADILFAAYTGGIANVSEWATEYKERAEKALVDLRFDSSADAATADGQNTGDGTITITTNDEYTMNEMFILRALSTPTKFSCHGSYHGFLPYDVIVGTQYPEKDIISNLGDYGIARRNMRYEEYPVQLLITAGAIDFVKDDKFTFSTYSASYFKQTMGHIQRG